MPRSDRRLTLFSRSGVRSISAAAIAILILGTEVAFFSGWPFALADAARAPVAFWLAVISLIFGGYEVLLRHNRSAASLAAILTAVLAAAAVGPKGAPGGTPGEIVSLVLLGMLLLLLLPATLKVGFRTPPTLSPISPGGDRGSDDQGDQSGNQKHPEENV